MGPGFRARLIIAWHGLGLALRRKLLTPKVVLVVVNRNREAVDVVSLCTKIRDETRCDEDRRQAAVDLIENAELRSLEDLIVVVYGPDPHPSVDDFEIAWSAWDVAARLAAILEHH